MTKKYDGYLFCTDYDGTLYHNGIHPDNLEAIREFTENGGRFTLATGRAHFELCPKDLPFTMNAPVVCMIGAQLWDYSEGCSLGDYPLTDAAKNVTRRICRYLRDQSSIKLDCAKVYMANENYVFQNHSAEIAEEVIDKMDGAYKVVFWLKDRYTPELFQEVKAICGEECFLCSNRADIFEITAPNVHKGKAVLALKKLLNAHTLICAGDFNGDIPMLRAADIGYAVENASDEVKAAADYVTVSAKDGAIARIIRSL